MVLVTLAAEVFLRGFVFAALSHWRGPWPALAITALFSAGPLAFAAGGEDDSVALLVPALLLGAVLCLLYLETGSLLAGIAVSAIVLGGALGQAFGWDWWESLLLAGGCAAVTLAAATSLAARRRPVGL